MLVLECGSFFEKGGKILARISMFGTAYVDIRTLVELILCFSLLSSVFMPICPPSVAVSRSWPEITHI
jgi:hypothetical protein